MVSGVKYWPNPAHKTATTEVGPPTWNPDKEKCPDDITIEERDQLFARSVPIDPVDPHARRFALRRRDDGRLQVFDVKFGDERDGEPEFHGHPASRVDRQALKKWRADGEISDAEYKRLVKELPGC